VNIYCLGGGGFTFSILVASGEILTKVTASGVASVLGVGVGVNVGVRVGGGGGNALAVAEQINIDAKTRIVRR